LVEFPARRDPLKKVAFSVLALGLALLAASCGGGSSSKGIVVALKGDVGSLDPAFAYDFTANPVVNEISEGLLKLSPSGELVPNLAESWESPDPLTYVYHLRSGVTFQDGSPMTADDVVFSLERIRDKGVASYLAWMFSGIAKIEKTDESTVKITLTAPDAQFKYAVATPAGHIISKAFYEAHKDDFGKPKAGSLGTGPFAFVSWKAGEEIKLKKYSGYWDKEHSPGVDEATFKIIEDGNTRATALKTGEADIVVPLPLDLVPLISAYSNANVQSVEGFTNDWIAFNTSRAPFSDVWARRAVALSFDVASIQQNIVKENGVPAKNQPVGPSLQFAAPDKWRTFEAGVNTWSFDLDKAKAALAKSTNPSGFKAKLVTDGDSFRLSVAQALQENAKAIGVEIEIVKVTESELTSIQASGKRDYDITLGGWGSDYPDPAANVQPLFISSNSGDGGSNYAAYKNPKVDELIAQQAGLSDDAKRAELLIQALTLADDDVPYIFVDHPKIFFAANKRVSGYQLSALWYWDSLLRTIKVQ
jgi:peptide/nickel transport system substrate-binding protein